MDLKVQRKLPPLPDTAWKMYSWKIWIGEDLLQSWVHPVCSVNKPFHGNAMQI